MCDCVQDPPEYFGGRYLAYKPDIPSELLRAATPPDREHPPQNMTHVAPQFDLVHHQYKQVRPARGLPSHQYAACAAVMSIVMWQAGRASGRDGFLVSAQQLDVCLLQLRSAWAIAQSLNRTLVLPEFWSGQDRCAVPCCPATTTPAAAVRP